MNVFIDHVRAGSPLVYCVAASSEYERTKNRVIAEMNPLNFRVMEWNPGTSGMPDLYKLMDSLQPKSILILRDFHHFLKKDAFSVLAKLKSLVPKFKSQNICIIVVSPICDIPVDIIDEMVIVDMPLPDKATLLQILDSVIGSDYTELEKDAIADSARGMSAEGAQYAFALSVVKEGRVLPNVVKLHKANAIKKCGYLEIIDVPNGVGVVGGMENVKRHCRKTKGSFTKEAIDFGCPKSKGIILFGCSGTGKSLFAKTASKEMGLMLVRVDLASLFTSALGGTEANVKQLFKNLKALAPCMVWLDEVEKAMGSTGGEHDGGTSQRMLGMLLTWMQEEHDDVYIIATANDPSKLPPELIRKGRWDEIFFVDLPTKNERVSIWEIQLRKYKRNSADFDCASLADITEGFTGAEIEAIVIDGLRTAFADGAELNQLHLIECSGDTVPLSRTMAAKVEALRQWGSMNAKPAGYVASSEATFTKREIIA